MLPPHTRALWLLRPHWELLVTRPSHCWPVSTVSHQPASALWLQSSPRQPPSHSQTFRPMLHLPRLSLLLLPQLSGQARTSQAGPLTSSSH